MMTIKMSSPVIYYRFFIWELHILQQPKLSIHNSTIYSILPTLQIFIIFVLYTKRKPQLKSHHEFKTYFGFSYLLYLSKCVHSFCIFFTYNK